MVEYAIRLKAGSKQCVLQHAVSSDLEKVKDMFAVEAAIHKNGELQLVVREISPWCELKTTT